MSTAPSKSLETFPNPRPGRRYEIRFECPEFTCLCPKTGQPDFATIRIRYVPDERCVELKSLKLYLWSYRDEGAFHEAVTNAIKYAVSAQESGAEIRIETQLVGTMLRIAVSDTGPGLKSETTERRLSGITFDAGEPVSTGVGLANIRERLEQAYGDKHLFETMEPAEGGFAVIIELPLETAAKPEGTVELPMVAAAAE